MRRKKNKLKKAQLQIIVSLIPIMATLLILVGNSYAIFTYLHRSENDNVIQAGTLNIEVADNGSVSIINSYPISDTVGLTSGGYQFRITNTGTLPTRYTVRLEKTAGEIASSDIRYSINNEEVYTLGTDGVLTIDKELLNAGSTNNYLLKLWIKEDASNDVLGKEFHAKLIVESLDAGVYADNSQAAYPKLDDNMIPIIYNTETKEWIKADLTQKWYDYNNRMWANVAIVTNQSTTKITLTNPYASDKNCTGSNNYCSRNDYLNAATGTVIPMDDIVAMFVWLPRYNYTLYNANQATKIVINFENLLANNYSKALGNCGNPGSKTSGCAYTHPAFTMGVTELTGLWVAKFETGMASINTIDETKTNNIFIKPNLYSLTNQQVSHQFQTASNLTSLYSLKLITHMMKDSEWGAVTYFANSQYGRYNDEGCIASGCEVWINNVSKNNQSLTGCSSTVSANATAITSIDSSYCNTAGSTDYINGSNASTTGNIYGIYDMAGGSAEYTMATNDSLPWANNKYYNLYTSLDPSTACNDEACYGYALNETAGWHNDYHSFIINNNFWLIRGGTYSDATAAGLFSYGYTSGSANDHATFRVIITK